MPSEEEIGLELDELVAMGDVEMLFEYGQIFYRLTDQGQRRLEQHELAMAEAN